MLRDLIYRHSEEQVRNEKKLLDSLQNFTEVFNSISTLTLVLNDACQVIFSSNEFLKIIDFTDSEEILGKRPGEVINCIHHKEVDYGCGNSSFCKYCGLFQSFLKSSSKNKKVKTETRLTVIQNGIEKSLEFSVTTTPVIFYNTQFYILSFTDISSEKRKLHLEKIFIHDLMNSAGGIKGLSEVLSNKKDSYSKDKILKTIQRTSRSLVEQISSYRNMLMAENDELEVKLTTFNTNSVINEAINTVKNNFSILGNFVVDSSIKDFTLTSDKVLLSRILVNMIKNAGEAENNKDTIILIGVDIQDDTIKIWVKNQSLIKKAIQKQIFKRSFSTKESGRGLGTYSMKLLGERYLGGEVGFISNKKDRTVFYIKLPINL